MIIADVHARRPPGSALAKDDGSEIMCGWLRDNIIAGHHEMLDGSGYPRHLKGDEILFEARIVAVADVLDALTTTRPYKKPRTIEEANTELNNLVLVGSFH